MHPEKWCIVKKSFEGIVVAHLGEMSEGTEGARGLKELEVKLPGPYKRNREPYCQSAGSAHHPITFEVQSRSLGFLLFKKKKKMHTEP